MNDYIKPGPPMTAAEVEERSQAMGRRSGRVANGHTFDRPPPGSGGNVQVCTRCGERDLPTLNPDCTGPRTATVDQTKHDYEPIL